MSLMIGTGTVVVELTVPRARTTRHCRKEWSVSRLDDVVMLLGVIAGWLGPTFSGLAVMAVIIWVLYRRYKRP